MFKNIFAIILFLSILVGCTACSVLPIDSTITTADDINNNPGIISKTEVTDNTEPSDDFPNITNGEVAITYDDINIDIKASYPVFHLSENDINERINQQIVDYIDSLYEKYYVYDNLFAIDTLYAITKYEINLLNEKIISIHFFSSFTGRGSPAYVVDKAFTFSIKTGEIISILDFYSTDQIITFINNYFDELDESLYPTLFRLYTKEQVKNDFRQLFNPESEYVDFYNSYYLTENKLFLIAGWYKGYTFDINSSVNGDRSFIIEINVENPI